MGTLGAAILFVLLLTLSWLVVNTCSFVYYLYRNLSWRDMKIGCFNLWPNPLGRLKIERMVEASSSDKVVYEYIVFQESKWPGLWCRVKSRFSNIYNQSYTLKGAEDTLDYYRKKREKLLRTTVSDKSRSKLFRKPRGSATTIFEEK